MENKKLLTLCIPTNGIIEWVFPVIDSIYEENIESSKFEVIVTDNGLNEAFAKKMMIYQDKYNNLIYKKTNAEGFLNQVEAFRLAKGEFVKFINHRTKLLPGVINNILEFVQENIGDKPVIFYSNGALNFNEDIIKCENFDDFVNSMSYFSSWSAGLAFWKEDFFNKLENHSYNSLFPHTDILFCEREKNLYYIDNRVIFEEITSDSKKKGSYLLFKAFGVDYISIILNLYLSGDIRFITFDNIRKKTLDFIAYLFVEFKILKKPCSYDLSDSKKYMNVFYKSSRLNFSIIKMFIKKVLRKFGVFK